MIEFKVDKKVYGYVIDVAPIGQVLLMIVLVK